MFLEYLLSCRSHIDHKVLFYIYQKMDLQACGFTVLSPDGYDFIFFSLYRGGG